MNKSLLLYPYTIIYKEGILKKREIRHVVNKLLNLFTYLLNVHKMLRDLEKINPLSPFLKGKNFHFSKGNLGGFKELKWYKYLICLFLENSKFI
ncbi:hypothetical protein BGP_5455 [Beggiatoa sp. PS]|nr:hypothetical protein BGP_5455 [Beggiatoa sp. PS]